MGAKISRENAEHENRPGNPWSKTETKTAVEENLGEGWGSEGPGGGGLEEKGGEDRREGQGVPREDGETRQTKVCKEPEGSAFKIERGHNINLFRNSRKISKYMTCVII